jgi:hypothetical protein
MTAIPLILLLLFAGAQAPKTETKEPEPSSAKPSVAVSFERLNLRENDAVNLTLIVSNDADYDLTNTSLEVHSPPFLHWTVVACNGQTFNPAKEIKTGAEPLIPVKARTTLKCELQVTTPKSIDLGEFNTLFVVGYQRLVGKNTDSSIVTTEKTLKANFLGSDTVAGVPLVLAGFIVPGLIFWVVVGLFNVPWKREGLGDQMIFSVLVSLVLLTIETLIRLVDLNEGISTGKLFRLAVGGLIAGLIAVGVDRAVRQATENRRLRDQINEGEDELIILAKLLTLPVADRVAQPMIELKTGHKYVGSLGARTAMTRKGSSGKTVLYSLVGSWEIKKPAEGTALRAEIDRLWQAKKMRQLIGIAKDNKLITRLDSLQTVDGGGNFTPSNLGGRSWREDEVAAIRPNIHGWGSPPLDFK